LQIPFGREMEEFSPKGLNHLQKQLLILSKISTTSSDVAEYTNYIRDRPFNLKGGGVWFFVSFRNFFSDNTRVRIFIFLSRKARNFFPEFNIRLYDKNSESDYFFFLHQNQNIFFSNIGNQNIFLEKNHNPSLQVKWSFPK
jgi:hypothetical protein